MGYEKWFDESKEEQRLICGMTYFQICLYFLIYSFGGWVVEVIFHAVALGKVINRGFLNGPVCPVYGFGVLSVFALLNTIQGSGRQMSDGMIFVFGIVLATAVELVAGWLLDVCFHARWWDYSNKKFNINGRICLTNLLFFGLMGLVMVYLVNPFLIDILNKIDPILLKCVVSILLVLFILDLFVSFSVTSKIKNVGKVVLKDSTEEINAKVKEILIAKGKLTRRITKAFPNFNIIIKQKKANE